MSECPNCGSAFLGANLIFGRFECGSTETNDPGVRRSRACALIRSLREELAELDERLGIVVSDRDEALSLVSNLRAELIGASDAERDQIADWIDAQGGTMSKIPDNGQCEHDQWSWTGCEMCGLEATSKSLRNNEHRSNT